MRRFALAPLVFALTLGSLHAAETSRDFRGTVEADDPDAGTMTIKPDAGRELLTGKAGAGDIAAYEPGDVIRGRIVSSGGQLYLENLWPAGKDALGVMQSVNQRLRRDTAARGQAVFRSVGEQIPDFALWDQRGDLVQADELRGKILVINFIFTRCTNASMCPASTQRMARLQDKVNDAGLDDVRFVSITLDPDYDTPGIFKAYADAYGIDGDTFYFLGGDARAVEDLKMQLGVLAEDDPRFIVNHTMRTILVGPDGRIAYQVPGSGWDVDDFLKQIRKLKKDTQ